MDSVWAGAGRAGTRRGGESDRKIRSCRSHLILGLPADVRPKTQTPTSRNPLTSFRLKMCQHLFGQGSVGVIGGVLVAGWWAEKRRWVMLREPACRYLPRYRLAPAVRFFHKESWRKEVIGRVASRPRLQARLTGVARGDAVQDGSTRAEQGRLGERGTAVSVREGGG